MMEANDFLIDGSILEGGGQIIRISLSCSSIFKIPVILKNIRGKRTKPGLQNQHLAGVKLLTEICNGQVSGDELQSMSLRFQPKTILSGNFEADSRTAGSVCLIMQAIIPTLLFAQEESSLMLLGGTDADFAPSINYYVNVAQFYMQKMGIEISIDLIKRGFYPRGGGKVKIDIESVKNGIMPINLRSRGNIISIKAICFVAGTLPLSIAKDMLHSMEQIIKSHKNYQTIALSSDVYKEPPQKAFGNGSGCMLLVETSQGCRFGFSLVGKRELSGSQMGFEVAKQFITFFERSNACLDPQMQDQILIFMALAKGQSTIRCSELTLHSQTCIHVLEKMIQVKFEVQEIEDSTDIFLSCDGLAVSNKSLADLS